MEEAEDDLLDRMHPFEHLAEEGEIDMDDLYGDEEGEMEMDDEVSDVSDVSSVEEK